MQVSIAMRWAAAAALIFSIASVSGCIKRVSVPEIYELRVEEPDYPAVRALNLKNLVGPVEIIGSTAHENVLHLRTRKWVETYSLLGLANPNSYLGYLETIEQIDQYTGTVHVDAVLKSGALLERLFVRVMPYVERTVTGSVALKTDVAVNVGDLKLSNLVGDVNASVNVGTLRQHTTLGIYGAQRYLVDVGNLNIGLSSQDSFSYDLFTEVGNIKTPGFNFVVNSNNYVGAKTAGIHGNHGELAAIEARVNVGNITLTAH